MTEAPPAPTTQAAPPAAPPSNEPAPAFSDFDATFSDGLDSPSVPAPAPSPSPAKDKPAADVGDVKPAKPVAPEPKKGEGTKASPEKPETEQGQEESVETDEYTPPAVANAAQLRGWALRQAKKAKQAVQRSQELEMRVKQLEAQPPKQFEANGNLAAELTAIKQENEKLRQDINLAKYEVGPDYEKDYGRPWKESVQRAYRQVKELSVLEPNPEDPERPRERPAQSADFDEVYHLPLGAARKLAKQKFGDDWSLVMSHYEKIHEVAERAFNAVQEWKGKAAQVETAKKAQEQQMEQGKARMFSYATEAHAKKYSELIMPRDGDGEGNDLLSKGRDFAGAVFGGNEGLSPQQVIMRDARAYNWLTAYPRLARDVKKLKGELDAANKTIEELRGSSPGKPTPSVESPAKTAGSILDDFDKHVT